jgi:sugar O-acyltransferase (sialic acid O-acetyltransferase NeuD family)
MATEVILPKLGMNMEEATIVRWLKREGDHVSAGEVLAEVETDKTTTDLEAEGSGVVRKLLAAEGERVAVSQTVAIIGHENEDVAELLARAAGGRPRQAESHAHVERVYGAWRGQEAHAAEGSNGAGAAVELPASTAAAGVAATDGARTIDPEAVRARLGLDVRRSAGAVPAPTRPKSRIVIYGAGLGAKQLLEVTRHLDGVVVIGLIDDKPEFVGRELAGTPVLGGFDALADLAGRGRIDGVALSFHSEVRAKVHRRLKAELGVPLVPLIDPRAMVGMGVRVGEGALIEAGAVVGPDTIVGDGVIVDVGAVVAHDCHLGQFSHLSPGCTLSGVVHLTENVMVGVGAALNSTVTVGRNVIVAPGAAVMNDVPDDVVVSGVPAKVIGRSRRGA